MNDPDPACRLLVDVSQYVSWPATSGVQRVLLHLASRWRGDLIDARYGFLDGNVFVTGTIRDLGEVIAATFAAETRWTSAQVAEALRGRSTEYVPVNRVEREYDAYLVPEPTFLERTLAILDQYRVANAIETFVVYYDALPLTHPDHHPILRRGWRPIVGYHRTVARERNVSFISQSVRNVFERRIARRSLENGVVIRPGADGLGTPTARRSPGVATFTVVGTVETRKRLDTVLDAFDLLWARGHDLRLIVVGARSDGAEILARRLERRVAERRAVWERDGRDDVLAAHLVSSAGMIFASDSEGYGLPPLEALALGCPVVVSKTLPSLESLEPLGQIRLDAVTADTIAAAVIRLTEEGTRSELARQASVLELPRWDSFASRTEEWIHASLQRDRTHRPDEAREECGA